MSLDKTSHDTRSKLSYSFSTLISDLSSEMQNVVKGLESLGYDGGRRARLLSLPFSQMSSPFFFASISVQPLVSSSWALSRHVILYPLRHGGFQTVCLVFALSFLQSLGIRFQRFRLSVNYLP